MKILIAGENASARMGGEAILPLNYARLLQARGHQVAVETHARNKAEITSDFPALAPVTHYIKDAMSHRVLWAVGNWFTEAVRDRLFGNLIVILTAWDMRRIVRAVLRRAARGSILCINRSRCRRQPRRRCMIWDYRSSLAR